MTKRRATQAEWADTEHWAGQPVGQAQACILELRARIEDLEAKDAIKRDQLLALEDDCHRLSKGIKRLEAQVYMDDPSRSLVQRVHSCIVGEPECGHMQANAVIREVAAWLREQHDGDLVAATVLEREAGR